MQKQRARSYNADGGPTSPTYSNSDDWGVATAESVSTTVNGGGSVPTSPAVEGSEKGAVPTEPAVPVKKFRGIPENVKLFEVFWHQVVELIKVTGLAENIKLLSDKSPTVGTTRSVHTGHHCVICIPRQPFSQLLSGSTGVCGPGLGLCQGQSRRICGSVCFSVIIRRAPQLTP